MQQYRLEINVVRPALEVRTERTSVGIRQQQARFRSEVEPARMQVRHEMPRFSIDRSQSAWAVNQMSVFDLSRSWSAEALQDSLRGIARIAEEGDRMMQIYQRHQTVAGIISDRFQTSAELRLVPVPRPILSWEPGRSEVEWTPFRQELKWDMPDSVTYDVQPGSVSTTFTPRPRVDIEFIRLDAPED